MAARGEKGSALLETALVVPLLVALLLGVSDFGRMLHYSEVVVAAARSGAEFAALSKAGAANLAGVEEATLSGAGLAGMTARTRTFTADGRQYLEVVTEYRFKPIWPYPGLPNPLPLKGTAVMRIQ